MGEWSFQLFSARNTPIADALRIVRDAGYSSVEAFRANVDEGDAFRSALADNELSVASMHIGRDRFQEDAAAAIALAQSYGAGQVVLPFLLPDERPADTAGWQALAREFAQYDRQCRDAGLVFSYHNHDFEFVALADGGLPMSILLESAPEMGWEIDLAWIVRAADNPDTWASQYSDRITAVHLKDVAPAGENLDEAGWADVGYGVLDWPQLVKTLKSSKASLYVIEHDAPSDLKRFAERSIATAESW